MAQSSRNFEVRLQTKMWAMEQEKKQKLEESGGYKFW